LLRNIRWFAAALAAVSLLSTQRAVFAQAEPQKVIFDTDIGDDVDDVYALALLGSFPNVKILGVTTAFGQTKERAQVAAKFLKVMGRGDIPVYAGRRGEAKIGRQYEWARGYQSSSIKSGDAAGFMKHEIDKAPGEIVLIAVGPLTNLGDLLTRYPEIKSKIKRIVIMGGAVYVGYNNAQPPTAEWNIKCDPKAAQTVYSSGIPVVMAGLEVTAMMQLDAERQKQLFAHGTPTTDALAALTNLWGNGVPTLFDPVAVAYAGGHPFADGEPRIVTVDDTGLTRLAGDGPGKVTVLVRPRKEEFLNWYVATVSPKAGKGSK
jgi:purine nucleosidase